MHTAWRKYGHSSESQVYIHAYILRATPIIVHGRCGVWLRHLTRCVWLVDDIDTAAYLPVLLPKIRVLRSK